VEADLRALLDGDRWMPTMGRALVYLPIPPPVEGSSMEASLRLQVPNGASNPGEFDRKAYLSELGVTLTGSCRDSALVRIGPPKRFAPVARYRVALREALLRDGGAEAGMLLALLLGERGLMDPDRVESLSRSGLYHLVALSGFNVGLVILVLASLAHLLGIHPLRRDILCLGACMLYGLVVAERPSFTRALLMAAAFLLARTFGRPQPGLRGWAIAAAVLLAVNPAILGDAGFQLTFLATLGILALTKAYPAFLPVDGWAGSAGRLVWVGFCAQAATLPTLIVHFQRFSPAGWLATPVAALPLLVVQALGLVYMAGGFAVPGLAMVLGKSLSWATKAFLVLPEGLGAWRWGSLFLPRPWWGWVALFGAGLALLALGGRRGRAGWVLAVFACAGAWAEPQPFRTPFPPGAAVLDVGQASCQVLLSGEDALLMDAGNGVFRGPSSGRQVVEPFLATAGVRSLGCILLTHWDTDHSGSLRDLLRDLPVGFVAYPRGGGFPPAAVRQMCLRSGVPLVALGKGDRFAHGPFDLRILWPELDPGCAQENDRCLVVRADLGKGSLLFPGDIGPCAEKKLVASGDLRSVQILLAPHHGAGRSSTGPFLNALTPQWFVVSAGKFNRFEHPSPATLERVAFQGAKVARTDLDGALWINHSSRSPRVWRYRDGDWMDQMKGR
jgi:competence protein ComEC